MGRFLVLYIGKGSFLPAPPDFFFACPPGKGQRRKKSI